MPSLEISEDRLKLQMGTSLRARYRGTFGGVLTAGPPVVVRGSYLERIASQYCKCLRTAVRNMRLSGKYSLRLVLS